MTTPAPAPMTARLREIIDVWVDAADGENERAHHLLDALTARVSRLLEAVEGAEKALEFYESAWVWDADDPGVGGRVPGETYQAWQEPSGDLIADLGHRAKAALATLRAAREGAR